MDVSAIIDERNRLIAEAGRILARSQADGTPWAGEDEQHFNRLHDRAADLLAQIQVARRTSAPAADGGIVAPVKLPSGALVVGTVRDRAVTVEPNTAAAGLAPRAATSP